MVSLEDILRQIDSSRLRQVAQSYQLDLIVLFGSYAKGRAQKESDMDIAVRTTHPDFVRGDSSNKAFWEMNLIANLSGIIPAPEGIDLVILNLVDSATLLYEVATYGIPLYQLKPMDFHQFRSYAARRFYDDAKFRRWGWEYLKRRCKIESREV